MEQKFGIRGSLEREKRGLGLGQEGMGIRKHTRIRGGGWRSPQWGGDLGGCGDMGMFGVWAKVIPKVGTGLGWATMGSFQHFS